MNKKPRFSPIHKAKTALNIISTYKTWPLAFRERLHLIEKKEGVHKLRNGHKYYVRARTTDTIVINELYIVKQYDRFLNKLPSDAVILDIGAHIGVFAVRVSKNLKNAKIYSYEPSKENYELLKRNINLNKLDGNIHAFRLGVGKKKEKRTLFFRIDNPAGSSLYDKRGKPVEISLISLKNVFDQNKIRKCNLLKLDCEGAEYEILLNTPKNYLKRIDMIVLEFHPNVDVNKIQKLLENNGFNVTIDKKDLPLLFAQRKS